MVRTMNAPSSGDNHSSGLRRMQWAAVSAGERTLPEAVAQAADRLLEALDGAEPDLVLVFVSGHHRDHFSALPGLLRREFDNARLIGCLGAAVIGNGHESGDQPAVSLLGAHLPGVQLQATHLEAHTLPPVYAERSLWDHALKLGPQPPDCQLLLADPFSMDMDNVLKATDRLYPNCPRIGALAGGLEQPGTPLLLLDERVYASGALCLSMSGDITMDTIVAQGCRPIGEPMFANATHENLILQLDGKPPREVLTDLYQRIPRSDRKLFTDALFMGLAMETRQQYDAGDFLIRTILGLDPDSGALLVNTQVPAHAVVQLHVRDARSSARDLEQQLHHHRLAQGEQSGAGVLLLSCVGRSAEFYGQPDHDCNVFRQCIGDLPIGGLFCNGEIGPVRGATYVHGYTSVFGIFKPKTPRPN